jgi:hypothetical protein
MQQDDESPPGNRTLDLAFYTDLLAGKKLRIQRA